LGLIIRNDHQRIGGPITDSIMDARHPEVFRHLDVLYMNVASETEDIGRSRRALEIEAIRMVQTKEVDMEAAWRQFGAVLRAVRREPAKIG
jgi:hypothetical protein